MRPVSHGAGSQLADVYVRRASSPATAATWRAAGLIKRLVERCGANPVTDRQARHGRHHLLSRVDSDKRAGRVGLRSVAHAYA